MPGRYVLHAAINYALGVPGALLIPIVLDQDINNHMLIYSIIFIACWFVVNFLLTKTIRKPIHVWLQFIVGAAATVGSSVIIFFTIFLFFVGGIYSSIILGAVWVGILVSLLLFMLTIKVTERKIKKIEDSENESEL